MKIAPALFGSFRNDEQVLYCGRIPGSDDFSLHRGGLPGPQITGHDFDGRSREVDWVCFHRANISTRRIWLVCCLAEV